MKKDDKVIYKPTGEEVSVTWVGNHTCFIMVEGREVLVPHKDIEEK